MAYSFHSLRTVFRWELRMLPTSNNQQYCHLSAFSCTCQCEPHSAREQSRDIRTSTMSAFLSSLVFFATFVNETSIRGQFSFMNAYLRPSSPTLERFDFGISVDDYTGSIGGMYGTNSDREKPR